MPAIASDNKIFCASILMRDLYSILPSSNPRSPITIQCGITKSRIANGRSQLSWNVAAIEIRQPAAHQMAPDAQLSARFDQ